MTQWGLVLKTNTLYSWNPWQKRKAGRMPMNGEDKHEGSVTVPDKGKQFDLPTFVLWDDLFNI